jgi:2-dehydro-3-deoxygluconokinase
MIQNKAREHGVDTSHIVWCEDERVGVSYVEYGAYPRTSSVIYDRKDSSLSKIHPDDVDWDSIFDECQVFMVSGITPALSDSARETTRKSIELAKKHGRKVCIDINYRVKLWSEEGANKCMSPLMSSTDILMTTEEDTARVLGIEAQDYKEVAKLLHEKFGIGTVVITLRENISVWKNRWTAICYDHGKLYETKTYELEIVDRVGGGDSLTAAFVHGYLRGDIQEALDNAVAFSAIKHTHFGDFCWATMDEVEKVKGGGSLRIAR